MDVAKWMSRLAGNKGKSLLSSTIITLAIIAMLIFSGPVQAVAVGISGLQDTYAKGNDIDFQVMIEINDPDKYVPVTNISLDLTGPVDKKIFFNLDGKRISRDCNIKINPVSIPTLSNDIGYGSGYGYDAGTGYGYDFGYGYGYGYGHGAGGEKLSFIYNVSINTATRCLPAGNYSVVAGLNTGNNVVFRSSTFSFTLLPAAQGGIIKARVDIKPETINLESNGKFTAFIRLPDGFDVRDIDVATVVTEGAHAVKSMISKDKGGMLIAKFNTQDLEVPSGNKVKFTVTGELLDGTVFEGSDTVNVIKDQDEDCECDDDEMEDGCDEHVDEHKHEDEYKKNANNKEKVVIVNNNNIYITNNTGTVNINIYDQDGGVEVNHVSNNNEREDNENKHENKEKNNKKGKDK